MKNTHKIPVLKPSYTQEIKEEHNKVLDSGWTGNGPKVKEFEAEFAKLVGARYAVATNSCTSALDLCLKAYDIRGGELITTPMTFVADAWVGENNGMDVTFADIDEDTLCIDPKRIKFTKDTKAIIAVDSHGRLADIQGIRNELYNYNKVLPLADQIFPLIIEDAAHACHTPFAGQGDITVWSFQAVKSMPISDGGMITTYRTEIAQKCRDLYWLGVEKSTYERVTGKGYAWDYDIKTANAIKGYMTDRDAVIGLGQLKRLNELLTKRRYIQEKYNKAFCKYDWFKAPAYSSTVQYYTPQWRDRDGLYEYLAEKGISTSVHFKPLSETTYWKKAKKHSLPVTERVWPKLLSLPCFHDLTEEEQDYIIENVIKFHE